MKMSASGSTLESNYNTLIKVQSATLDTLNEGVAVFGPDGRLKLSNAAFARIWDFEARGIAGRTACPRLCRGSPPTRFGDSAIWDRLIQAIVSRQRDAQAWAKSNAATAPSCP